MDDRAYAYLKRQLAALLDIDIDAYKSQQMRRRLETFVSASGLEPMVFARRLTDDERMLAELRDMLTINVSEFFRDPPQFERLERSVLPDLLGERRRLRLWSAGCSGGHEPYSLAILLEELGVGLSATILASDFDREVLRRAQAGGPYAESELHNVSPQRLECYFTPVDGGYVPEKSLRRRIKFRELNLLKDRFDDGFDLIVCRNVMIYFAGPVKAKLVRRFFDSLTPGGVLFVGATEALIGEEVKCFERLGGNFYRRPVSAATLRSPRLRAA